MLVERNFEITINQSLVMIHKQRFSDKRIQLTKQKNLHIANLNACPLPNICPSVLMQLHNS